MIRHFSLRFNEVFENLYQKIEVLLLGVLLGAAHRFHEVVEDGAVLEEVVVFSDKVFEVFELGVLAEVLQEEEPAFGCLAVDKELFYLRFEKELFDDIVLTHKNINVLTNSSKHEGMIRRLLHIPLQFLHPRMLLHRTNLHHNNGMVHIHNRILHLHLLVPCRAYHKNLRVSDVHFDLDLSLFEELLFVFQNGEEVLADVEVDGVVVARVAPLVVPDIKVDDFLLEFGELLGGALEGGEVGGGLEVDHGAAMGLVHCVRTGVL